MYVFDADGEKLVRNRLEIMARVSYFDQLGLETSPYIRLPHSFRAKCWGLRRKADPVRPNRLAQFANGDFRNA